MRVLGIDPGSVISGYGVVEQKGKHFSLIEYGVIEARKAGEPMPLRLKTIFTRVQAVIERSLPDEAAVESIFYAKNVASVIKLSHARGAAILAATMQGIPVAEYSPREVKRAVTGSGNASKEQVQYMVRGLLSIEETPDYYDKTDALAIALCHIIKAVSPVSRPRSWKQFIDANPERIVKSTRKTS